jgi:hypothetical protein
LEYAAWRFQNAPGARAREILFAAARDAPARRITYQEASVVLTLSASTGSARPASLGSIL